MYLSKKVPFTLQSSLFHSLISYRTIEKPSKFLLLNLHCLLRYRCDFIQNELHDVSEDYLYNDLSDQHMGVLAGGHNVLLIQPYIKWGRGKTTITTPQLQMQESEALIRTLPHWKIVHKIFSPLQNFNKKYIVGSGSFNDLKNYIQRNNHITAIYFGLETLKNHQTKALKHELGIEVFDRYSLIIHIFRIHAKSPEAKLQVALAEIPYVRRKLNLSSVGNTGMINLFEHQKNVLDARESKLRKKLEKLKEHRQLIRKGRLNSEIPTVAVVGYTNSGKTSLIKALTGDVSLVPKNQLFATLDSTVHKGILPCKLNILYVDTIGFIQNVPEMLIEPFRATLSDVICADIIIHVYDISHPDRIAQVKHVENTIKSMPFENMPIVINVANKCDLLPEISLPLSDIAVIAKDLVGIKLLKHRIQQEILTSTNRKILTMRVKSGSPAEAWIYKRMTVIDTQADSNDLNNSLLNVITTDNQLHAFKRYLRKTKIV